MPVFSRSHARQDRFEILMRSTLKMANTIPPLTPFGSLFFQGPLRER